MIRLLANNARSDISSTPSESDLLLRIVSDFSLEVDGRVIYAEVEFPVVELASQLKRWCMGPRAEAFEYESMESDETGLVWIRQEGAEWRIGSIRQAQPAASSCTDQEIEAAIEEFVARVVTLAKDVAAVDVSDVL